MDPLRSFAFGLSLPVRAARLIFSKGKLAALSLLPLLVAAALNYYLYSYVHTLIHQWAAGRMTAMGWGTEGWFAGVLFFFIKILSFLAAAVSFSFIAGVVSAPVNDFLAEASEPLAEPPLPTVPSPSFGTRARLIGIDIIKTLAALAFALVFLLLSWVPFLGPITLAASMLLLVFQYISYPQTRRGQGLGEGFKFLFQHFFACLGFGLVLSAMFSVPVISSLFFPLAVVGGTLLYARAQGKP